MQKTTVKLIKLGANKEADEVKEFRSSLEANYFLGRPKDYLWHRLSRRHSLVSSVDNTIYFVAQYGRSKYHLDEKLINRGNLTDDFNVMPLGREVIIQYRKEPRQSRKLKLSERLAIIAKLEAEFGSLSAVPEDNSLLNMLREKIVSEEKNQYFEVKVEDKAKYIKKKPAALVEKAESLLKYGVSPREISEKLNVRAAWVYKIANSKSIPIRKMHAYKLVSKQPSNPRFNRPLYASCLADIARYLGVSATNLYRKLDKLGYSMECVQKYFGDLKNGEDYICAVGVRTKGYGDQFFD